MERVRGLRSALAAGDGVPGCSSRGIDKGAEVPRGPEADIRDAVGIETMASSVQASILMGWMGSAAESAALRMG